VSVDTIDISIEATAPIVAVFEGEAAPTVVVESLPAIVVVIPGQQGVAGTDGVDGAALNPPNVFTDANTSPVVLFKCMPARIQTADGTIKRARAMGTSDTVRKVGGLVLDDTIAIGDSGRVQTSGPFVATTAQWDAVTGETGGLVPGAIYWMSAEFGRIARVAPDTTLYLNPWLIEIGTAKSTTEMVLRIAIVMQLASP
jgi:hypothetical protein